MDKQRLIREILIVRAKKESDWTSCQSIVNNLELAYRSADGLEVKSVLHHDNENDDFEAYQIISKIFEFSPSEIVFIDHKPHPGKLIQKLRALAPAYKPKLTFHIFGDFVLQAPKWQAMDSFLKNFPVQFICASDKQKNLIDSFLNQPSCTSVIPFPVNSKDFYFDENERKEVRRSFELRETDFLFLYTGRISQQKNVLELIKAMNSCSKLADDNLYFFFAGPFDDNGIPYKGQENPPGTYFQRWEEVRKSIDGSKIRYVHNLEPRELRGLYNAADAFISLSTHNDEDFGMSPAESLMSGLQVVLTDWGGYSSFKSIVPKGCELLPVKHDHVRLLPEMSSVQKYTYKKYNDKKNDAERRQLANLAANQLSIERIADKISASHEVIEDDNFHGFNSHFYKLSTIMTPDPYRPFAPFRGAAGEYSDYFFETYRPYFQELNYE